MNVLPTLVVTEDGVSVILAANKVPTLVVRRIKEIRSNRTLKTFLFRFKKKWEINFTIMI